MKSIVILCGTQPRHFRVQTLLQAGAEVHSVLPSNLPAADESFSVSVPSEWLSQSDSKPRHRKEWEKADTLALAAIRELALKADFYWVIESDCCAPVERWEKIFADWDGDLTDAVFYRPRSRVETAWNPWWAEAPAWANLTHLNACYRLSRAAVDACTEAAVEMREVFCEMTVGSVVKRAGLSIGSLNARTTHANCQTMKASPDAVIVDRKLLNHPVKTDSFGMDGVTSSRGSQPKRFAGQD